MAEKEYEIYEVVSGHACDHCIFDAGDSCAGGSDDPAPDVKRACRVCIFADSLCAGSISDPDAPNCVTAAVEANIRISRAAFRWKDQQNG